LRDRLSHLQVITALGTDPTRRIVENDTVMAAGWPRYVHKLVSAHPITGQSVLEICPMSSVRIESMSTADSQALLED
jgi:alpha-ketoglutarate-dependent taurine dioxygenase